MLTALLGIRFTLDASNLYDDRCLECGQVRTWGVLCAPCQARARARIQAKAAAWGANLNGLITKCERRSKEVEGMIESIPTSKAFR